MDHKPEGSKFKCSICSFTTETSLEQLSHLTTHIYEKLEYVCSHCDFISSYREIVVDHMKIHEQDSQFLIDEVLNDSVDDTFDDITKENKPVKKRGRPPKLFKDIKIETLDLDLEDIKRDEIKTVKNQSRQPKPEVKSSEESFKEIKLVKKRGRPPKSKPGVKSTEESVKEIKIVKKRGRPPKSETLEKNRKPNQPVKNNCKPPVPEQIKTETLDLEEIREIIKSTKRRGRPPKLKVKEEDKYLNVMEPNNKEVMPSKIRHLQTEAEEEHYCYLEEMKPLKRKPGRPPKAKGLKPETQEEIAEEIKPVKKRGRPPKHLKTERQEEISLEIEIKPVKKRGRPPKHLKNESPEEIAEEIKSIKKLGRPPKPKALEIEAQVETGEEIKAIKKRVRPPKGLQTEKHKKTKLEENFNVHQKIECHQLGESKSKKTLAKQRGSPKVNDSQVLSFSEEVETDTEVTFNNFSPAPAKPKRVRNTGPYICSVCEKHFRTKLTLKNHRKLHSVNKLKCSKCHFVCKSKKIMRLHMKVHAGQKFSCEQCAEVFPTRKMKRQHLKMNHADVLFPFFCRECGYSCNNMFSIKKHIRRYHPTEGGKQQQVATDKYSCPHCSYSTHNKAHLTIHIRVHTGERPYQCTTCSYRATQFSALKSHMMRLHPEQNNSSLSLSSFSTSSNLDEHFKVHGNTKRPWCNICGRSFFSIHNLFRHNRLHSLGHACHLCKKIFFYSKAFVRHLKCHDAAKGNKEMVDGRKSPTKSVRTLKAPMLESDASLPGISGEAAVNVQTKTSSNESSKVAKSLKNKSQSLLDTKPNDEKHQCLVESTSGTLVSPNKEISVNKEMKSAEKLKRKTKRGKGLKNLKPNNLDASVEEKTQTNISGAHKKDSDGDALCVPDHKLIEEKLDVVDHALSAFLQVLKRKLQTSGAGSANSSFSGSSKK